MKCPVFPVCYKYTHVHRVVETFIQYLSPWVKPPAPEAVTTLTRQDQ